MVSPRTGKTAVSDVAWGLSVFRWVAVGSLAVTWGAVTSSSHHSELADGVDDF